MVLRQLLNLLANQHQLVEKLSESYPVRRAAQVLTKEILSFDFFCNSKRSSLFLMGIQLWFFHRFLVFHSRLGLSNTNTILTM